MLTPKPVATLAAGAACIRRIASSWPPTVSLAFLCLFTFSPGRFRQCGNSSLTDLRETNNLLEHYYN